MGGWWESRGQRFSGGVYWQEKSINKNVFLCHESKLGIFNWERRNGIGSRLKSFDIIRVHWKIQFLGGEGSRKTKRGNCLKRERLGQFADLRGTWRKRGGGGGLRGGWYPNAHYVTDLPRRFPKNFLKLSFGTPVNNCWLCRVGSRNIFLWTPHKQHATFHLYMVFTRTSKFALRLSVIFQRYVYILFSF